MGDYTNFLLIFIATEGLVILYLLSTARWRKPQGDSPNDKKLRKEIYDGLIKMKADIESTVD